MSRLGRVFRDASRSCGRRHSCRRRSSSVTVVVVVIVVIVATLGQGLTFLFYEFAVTMTGG